MDNSHHSSSFGPQARDQYGPTPAPFHPEGISPQRITLTDLYGNDYKTPEFTVKQIRDAIPRHCYNRSAAAGLYYVVRDFACLALVFFLFSNHVTAERVPFQAVRLTLWAIYSAIQGLFFTGIWVLGHECGHQAFSRYRILNDTVGWICHSFVFVPYFSFKFSHSQHHKATGNITRDMGFVPQTRGEFAASIGVHPHELSDLTEEIPIVTAISLILQQLIGWPIYLLTNWTGHDNHDRQREGRGKGKHNGLFGGVNHFDPASPLFEAKHANAILLSDLGLLLMGAILYLVGRQWGWSNLLTWYGIPYAWVNHWIAAITYLQHTDASVPHYTPEAWTFTRGASATVDRDLGFIGRHIFHRGTDTHVLHHFVSTIPFYHAGEATEAIKEVMGEHYRRDPNTGMISFVKALWINYRMCQWIEPTEGAKGEAGGILFFRNHNGIGVPPAKMVQEE